MTEENTLPEKTVEILPSVDVNLDKFLESTHVFEHVQRVAKVFASSDLVPKTYQNKLGNCIVALNAAHRMNIDPFLLMQNSTVVNGKLGLDGKLIAAIIKSSGKIKGDIDYNFEGKDDTLKCTASCETISGKIKSATCSIEQAKKLGWYGKSDFWKGMPEDMLIYRSTSFLGKRHFPELTLGLHTIDELRDSPLNNEESTITARIKEI